MIATTPLHDLWRGFVRACVSTFALVAIAWPVGAAPQKYGEPAASSRSDAQMHNLATSRGRAFTLVEYSVPTPNAVPHILAIDEHDQVWFSESGGQFAKNFIDTPPVNRIGRLDQNGGVSEWTLTERASPMGILFDRQGNLWIAERVGNRISVLRTDGSVQRYDLAKPDVWPTGIAIDSKQRLWITETRGNAIAMLDPASGELTEHPFPKPETRATGIAVDAHDRVWVAERDANAIGLFDPASGDFRHFSLPTNDSRPCNVVADEKGTIWFSERNGGKIGTIDASGAITEYALPDRFGGPFIMVADKRGDIWFSEIFANRITVFHTADRTFEHYPIASAASNPAGLALDSKGNVWFAEQTGNKIGVIVRTDLAYLAGEPSSAATIDRTDENDHTIREHDVPTKQAIPGIVQVDRRGNVWFTEMGGGFVGPGFPPGPPGSRIGRIRDGKLTELATPTPESGPTSMAKDPCGDDIWVTLRSANRIARIRDDVVTEYEVPVPDSQPVGIAVDLDHNVWVALNAGNKVGRRTPQGEWKFLDIPLADAQPRTIFVDRANEVWFAEKIGNHIGRIDREKWELERWEIPTRMAWPLSLEEDEEGNLWFAEMRSDRLGMLDRVTHEITEYKLPLQSAPFKILPDRENNCIWISTVFANAILRFDMTAKKLVASYRVPNEGAWVGGLDRDASGCIWFSEQFANKIGHLCIDGVKPPSLREPATKTAATAG